MVTWPCITKLRENALSEVWSGPGYVGVVALCKLSEAPGMVGWHLAAGVFDAGTAQRFVATVLADDDAASRQAMDRCLLGLFVNLDADVRREILSFQVTTDSQSAAKRIAFSDRFNFRQQTIVAKPDHAAKTHGMRSA